MDRVASAERKADCASLTCDLVQYAPAENVRLYALQVTGPLIRIVGDKYSSEVRVTISVLSISFSARVEMLYVPSCPSSKLLSFVP